MVLFLSQIFDSSSASLPAVAAQVNSSFEAANGNLSEVQQTLEDSGDLLDDVTEAEGMHSFELRSHALETFSF